MGRSRAGALSLLLRFLLGLGLVVAVSCLPAAQAQRTWVVATDPTYAPFEMVRGAAGALEGFDVDLIRAVAKDQGRTVRFVTLPFDGLIPALRAGRVDLAISAMTITAQRAESVAFSRPYFAAGLGVVVQRDGPTIPSLDALAGRQVAVQIGSTGALAVGRIPGVQVSSYDSAPLALQALLNGQVEAYVNDLPATLYAIRQRQLDNVRVSSEPLTADYYGIALPLGSPLRDSVDQGLSALIRDGRLAQLHRRWFGRDPAPLPAVAPQLQSRPSAPGLDPLLLVRNLSSGAAVTLALTCSAFLLGSVCAALLTLALMAGGPWQRRGARVVVNALRGTPLLVQLFLVYFGLPALCQSLGLQLRLPPFLAAVATLSCNLSAYMAETLRAGIASIDRGQWQAADALGLRPWQRLRHVILPQALQRVLPPLGNEFITLIKDTSLAAVIGFDELFRQGQLIVATTYRAFEVYAAVGLTYLLLTAVAAQLLRELERRLTTWEP